MLCERRCAVTVISSRVWTPDSSLVLAAPAAYAVADTLPRIAATAYETFAFIVDIPLRFLACCAGTAPAPTSESSPLLRCHRLNARAIRMLHIRLLQLRRCAKR